MNFIYRLAAACGLWAVAAQSSSAAGLKVAPVHISLDSQNAVQVLRVKNSGDELTRIQVRIFSWGQSNGEDRLLPTRDVLVNPAQFELAPGNEQSVRIGRITEQGQSEQSYRLLVEEVPSVASSGHPKVQMLLRISVPVFIPAPEVARELSWIATAKNSGNLDLFVENLGNTHVQLNRITVKSSKNGPDLGSREQMIYLLPGSKRKFSIPLVSTIPVGQPVYLFAESVNSKILETIVVSKSHAKVMD